MVYSLAFDILKENIIQAIQFPTHLTDYYRNACALVVISALRCAYLLFETFPDFGCAVGRCINISATTGEAAGHTQKPEGYRRYMIIGLRTSSCLHNARRDRVLLVRESVLPSVRPLMYPYVRLFDRVEVYIYM